MTSKTREITDYDGSTPLKSIMQEMFVSNLIKGMTQADAYKNAGYKSKCPKSHANQLMTISDHVRTRIAYKRVKAQEKLEITEESQIKRFKQLSQGAEVFGQYSASISAEDKITTICGLYEKDNAQKGDKTLIVGDTERMEQLEAELALLKRSKALGSAVCTG